MRKILFLICILSSFSGFSKQLTSVVDKAEKDKIMKIILENRKTAQFDYLYKFLNENTRILRVFHAAVYFDNPDTINYSYDFSKNITNGGSDYLLYNSNNDSANAFAYYLDKDTNDLHLSPSVEIPESFLNDVKRYYKLDVVVFVALAGVPGLVVMVKDEVWVIDGNTRPDLNTYVKEYYPKLDELRNIFLLKRNP